jgi:hypothetical protein
MPISGREELSMEDMPVGFVRKEKKQQKES